MNTELNVGNKDIQEFLKILYKRRWLIISFSLMILIATIVYNFSATPIYKATARIEISKENPNVVSIQEVMAMDATGSDYYQTQYQIIESRTVARKVIHRLNLANNSDFNPKNPKGTFFRVVSSIRNSFGNVQKWIRSMLNTDNGDQKAIETNTSEDAGLVSRFIDRITVTPIRSSRLVDISMEAKNPENAAIMSNALVQAYIDHNLEIKLSAAKNAVLWLSERIGEQRKKVEDAEKALLTYKEKNEIITNFSSDAEHITAQKLAQLNAQVIDSGARRVEAETRYLQALKLKDSPDMLNSIPEVIDNKLVSEIKKMEVDLYTKMSELSKKYGRNHPKMVAINLELEDLNKSKITAVNQIINSLRNEYELALAREESLKKALAQQKKESLRMNKMAIQYGVLQREAESSRNMYDMLINRFKETSLTEEMKTGNIRIIDRAEMSNKPDRPRTKQNIILAIIIGLSLGTGLAFGIEFLDNTIKSPDEIKQNLNIPFLGVVPAFFVDDDSREVSGALVTAYSRKSIASESFRSLRTSIQFSTADAQPRVIMITSAGIREGKSVIAANLAITMAQAGSKTLLIDCDMRRPTIHTFFNSKSDTGLSNLLVGKADVIEAIHPSGIKGLEIIPCGPVPPNPSEIIGSKNMEKLMGALRKKYTHIIIDTPPISAISDALALTPLIDGAILVIRVAETPRKIIQNMIERIKTVNCRILGAVLNGVSEGNDSYYYQQYHYYYGSNDAASSSRKKKKFTI